MKKIAFLFAASTMLAVAQTTTPDVVRPLPPVLIHGLVVFCTGVVLYSLKLCLVPTVIACKRCRVNKAKFISRRGFCVPNHGVRREPICRACMDIDESQKGRVYSETAE